LSVSDISWTLIRIEAPNFTAGLLVDAAGIVRDAAPIVRWAIGKPLEEIREYAVKKRWELWPKESV
jgi:hypothetical protein